MTKGTLPPTVVCLKTAENFLRCNDHGVTNRLLYDRDSNWLEITIKGINNWNEEIVWRLLVQLPLADKKKYEQSYLSAVKNSYEFWKTLYRKEDF